VPIGILLLRWVPPGWLRMAIGALLILFSLYNLARPKLPEVKSGRKAAGVGVGFLNGVVGGSTGLAGILIVIWANMRGWPRDEQRAAFQPTADPALLRLIPSSCSHLDCRHSWSERGRDGRCTANWMKLPSAKAFSFSFLSRAWRS
jgi:hypothetical protein